MMRFPAICSSTRHRQRGRRNIAPEHGIEPFR
jgi:hypothetical protein